MSTIRHSDPRPPSEAVDRLIARASQQGKDHILPLLRMVQAGQIALAFIPRGAKTVRLAASGCPLLAILQDNDHASTGPAGFPVARKVLRWAAGLVLHAAGGEGKHYEMIGQLALACGGLAVVETSTAHLSAWHAVAERTVQPDKRISLIIVPRHGAAHPLRRAVLH